MNDVLKIAPSELVAHGANIDAIAGQLGVVMDTAGTVSAAEGAAAFGALCAPFVIPILSAAEGAAKGFINAAKETAGIQGQAACGLAELYTDTDEAGRRGIDQVADSPNPPKSTGAQS